MIIRRAKEVLKIEADAINSLIKRIDKTFEKAVDLIYACKGRVVVTGMGKGGLIGQKISATLSSVGTPSLWMHSVEAIHGDLGRVAKEDIVIVISKSGETEEIRASAFVRRAAPDYRSLPGIPIHIANTACGLIQAQKEAASELAPTQAHCVFACDAWRLLLKKGI